MRRKCLVAEVKRPDIACPDNTWYVRVIYGIMRRDGSFANKKISKWVFMNFYPTIGQEIEVNFL